jgi:sugar O-acyltransferase (sialic acid O-acetyltransferase NeuD family)
MRIVVVGAGAQGLIVAEILLRARAAGGGGEPVAFVDDEPSREGTNVLGIRVAGPVAAVRDVPHDAVIVAIGDNGRRREVSAALAASGERFAVALHPFSSVAPDVSLPPGAMVSAGVIICPGAVLGEGVLLNTRASVDHESRIGEFAHVSCGATLGGRVVIGAGTFIGLGASVLSGVRIGADSLVGAGAVVVRDLPGGVVAYGNPARPVRANR